MSDPDGGRMPRSPFRAASCGSFPIACFERVAGGWRRILFRLTVVVRERRPSHVVTGPLPRTVPTALVRAGSQQAGPSRPRAGSRRIRSHRQDRVPEHGRFDDDQREPTRLRIPVVTTTGFSAGAHTAIVTIAMSNTSDTTDRGCGMSFTGGSVTASDNFAVINGRTRSNTKLTDNVTFTARYRSTTRVRSAPSPASSIIVQVIS